MKHLKKFETYDIYDKLKNMLALPNVFYCMNTNEVYYNNNADFIIKYAVDTDDPVQLYFYNDEITGSNPFLSYGVDAFNNIEIDGVNVSITDLDKNKGKYAFTSGEHTVKYILKKRIIGIIGDNFDDAGALFATCNNIKDVIINISNDIIFGGSVFAACASLINVTILNNITNIGGGAFMYCTSLTRINISNSVISIDSNVFAGCSGLTSIDIPDSVTSISDHAFYGCSSLTSIVIPNSVTSISESVFYGCSSLTNINIPDSVTSISGYAFQECTSLTNINIPSSITSIGTQAFNDCSSLTSITVNATTPPILGDRAFNLNTEGRKIYVPSASVDAYKAAYGWREYADKIQAIPSE